MDTNLRVRVEVVGARKADNELEKVENQTRKTERATDGLRKSFKGLGGVLAGVGFGIAARAVVKAADTFQMLNAKLRLVSDSNEEATRTYQELLGVANSTRSDLESSVELYARLARSTESLGLEQKDLLQLTTTINQAFKVSGASTAEASAAITQLSQAFASGVLRGDEFNSVNEQAPRLMEAVAKGLKVERGELRALAADGKLTADIISKALAGQADEIQSEFDQLPVTVGDSLQQLQNDLFNVFGKTDTGPLVDGIQELRDIVNDPAFQENMVALASAIAKVIGFTAQAASTFVDFGRGIGETAARLIEGENEIMATERAIEQLEATINSGVIIDGKLATGIRLATGEFLHQGTEVEVLKEKLKGLQEQQEAVFGSAPAATEPVAKGKDKKTEDETPLLDTGADKLTPIQKRIQALQTEAETYGKSAKEVELYKLKLKGATEEELKAAEAALDTVATLEAAEEKRKEQTELAEARKEAFADLVESLRNEEEVILQSYEARREMILENTAKTSNERSELLKKLNEDAATSILDGYGSSDPKSLEDKEAAILEEYQRRMELIEELEGDQTELELELTRRRNEQLAELDEERRRQMNEGWSALLDVMSQYYQGMEGEEAAYARAAIQIGQTLLDEKKRESIQKIWTNTSSAAMGAYDAMASIPYVGPALGAAAAGAVYIAGAAAAGKVAGLYDEGGFIPGGKYGIVGEYGPELVEGPANVTSRKETAAMARSAMDGSQQAAPQLTVQNIVSPSLVLEALNTPDGEDVIKNIMTRNRELF